MENATKSLLPLKVKKIFTLLETPTSKKQPRTFMPNQGKIMTATKFH
jgi:hypothetical protein